MITRGVFRRFVSHLGQSLIYYLFAENYSDICHSNIE